MILIVRTRFCRCGQCYAGCCATCAPGAKPVAAGHDAVLLPLARKASAASARPSFGSPSARVKSSATEQPPSFTLLAPVGLLRREAVRIVAEAHRVHALELDREVGRAAVVLRIEAVRLAAGRRADLDTPATPTPRRPLMIDSLAEHVFGAGDARRRASRFSVGNGVPARQPKSCVVVWNGVGASGSSGDRIAWSDACR